MINRNEQIDIYRGKIDWSTKIESMNLGTRGNFNRQGHRIIE